MRGINLCRSSEMVLFSNLPRVRGDQPELKHYFAYNKEFAPHARGSTQSEYPPDESTGISPACAGINHGISTIRIIKLYFPRMRGDQPILVSAFRMREKFTPACAGINLPLGEYDGIKSHLPRMRGDQPPAALANISVPRFTPHVRGSTFCAQKGEKSQIIYPRMRGD